MTTEGKPSKHVRYRFDVDTTLYGRQQRCYNVETVPCAYWVRPLVGQDTLQSYTKDKDILPYSNMLKKSNNNYRSWL